MPKRRPRTLSLGLLSLGSIRCASLLVVGRRDLAGELEVSEGAAAVAASELIDVVAKELFLSQNSRAMLVDQLLFFFGELPSRRSQAAPGEAR